MTAYYDSEGAEKCKKEGPAQVRFLADRDQRRQNADQLHQQYIALIDLKVPQHEAKVLAGIGRSGNRWNTVPNMRTVQAAPSAGGGE